MGGDLISYAVKGPYQITEEKLEAAKRASGYTPIVESSGVVTAEPPAKHWRYLGSQVCNMWCHIRIFGTD